MTAALVLAGAFTLVPDLHAEGEVEEPAQNEPASAEQTEEPAETTTEEPAAEPDIQVGPTPDEEFAEDLSEAPEPGEDGEPGESTESTNDAQQSDTSGESELSEGDAVIETGDATAEGDIGTTENSNITAVDTPESSTTTIEVANENDAAASTTASVASATGANTAEGGTSATIDTGDAIATANVVNVVNTNIFNSTGFFYFINALLGNINLDTRNIFSILTGQDEAPEGGCAIDTPESCATPNTEVNLTNENTAVVENDITVSATTGSNTANAGSGDATVTTGDAFAAANVVNLVNTNITDSNYLLMTVNGFNAEQGDVIFPGADWFYELLHAARTQPTVHGNTSTTVTNDNTASVTTNGDVEANTGGNEASGDTATIETGDATAAATVVNQVNTNLFGDSLTFLFKVHGTWAGNIFGLPEGMTWQQTDDGVALTFSPTGALATAGSTEHLTVTNNNTATVTNNVSVMALTGDNEASSDNGGASVSTGDANAVANVVNVVNTNVLGRNWVLAVFNIFGDWTGDISFGQPDLWIGARALTPYEVRRGACFDYEITVNNLGDAAATNVVLEGIYDQLQQRIEMFEEDLDGRLMYHLGRIEAGGLATINIPTCINENVPGDVEIDTEFVVDEDENDADESNNNESISVVTVHGGGSALRLRPAELSIEKMASREIIAASSSVTYTITIVNDGDPVYNAMLIDEIYDADGTMIHEQRWALDTILAGETIVVSYDAFFSDDTEPGTYTNRAFISGTERHPDYETNLGNAVDSPIASVDIEVTGDIAVGVACEPLLTTYIKYGSDSNNRTEVGKLQYFLRSVEGHSEIAVTNEYDEVTHEAVHSFQEKYGADILEPWGMSKTSGYVYYTTQKKVNELWCADLDFSLTERQQSEINSYKQRVETYETLELPLPEDFEERFGMGGNPEEADVFLAREDTKAKPEEETTEVAENNESDAASQLAATAEALPEELQRSVWQALRERLGSMWRWMGN